ncbi:MAG: DNA polymerase III subunit delta [bacterium]|nr:DNA polymerase III subunit delta [bacterium]
MLVFLHGDDTFSSRARLRELRERFVREVDPSGMNLVLLDGAQVSADDVWSAVATQSFLVRERMVVVEDIGAAKSDAVRDAVMALLPKIPADVTVVFWEGCSHTKKPARKTKPKKATAKPRKQRAEGVDLFDLLRSGEHAEEFMPLSGAPLAQWARAYAAECGATLDATAARALATVVGGDLWRMRSEIAKLAMMGGGTITAALVREHVAQGTEDNIFAFGDALGHGDRRAAAIELQRLLAANADPQYLVTMIARQLRMLIMAADLLARGTPTTSLASALGCTPFVAQKIAEQARGQSPARLAKLYPLLLELDRTLKSSRAPRAALLELFCFDATA